MPEKRPALAGLAAGLPRTYWFLLLGTFVNALGTFVVPFLALYLTSRLGLPTAEVGLIVSLLGAGAFAGSLLGGRLADRLGRRPVLLASFLLSPPVLLLLGFASSPLEISFLSLSLGLISRLSRPSIGAAIADLVPPEEQTKAYGAIYWANNVGFTVAVSLAGLLASRNYLLLFFGDAVTTLAFGLIVLFCVPETRPGQSQVSGHLPESWIAMLSRQRLMVMFAGVSLGFGLIYMQGSITLPLDMQAQGMGPDQFGLAIAVNGALVALLGLPVSRSAKKWHRYRAMAVSVFLLGTGFGMIGLAHGMPAYVLAIAVWTFGEIGGSTVAPAIVADLSAPDVRGLNQGLFQAAWNGLASFLGPLAGGWLFSAAGPSTLWTACFGLGTGLAVAVLLMAGPAERRSAEIVPS